MNALPLRIGYGPPGAVEHRASVGRATMALGLGICAGVVFGVPDTIALDSGRGTAAWYTNAAAAIGIGLLLTALLARAAGNLGTRVGSMATLAGAASGACWLILFNTGDPAAVELLVLVGISAAVPALALASVDASELQPAGRALAAVGHPAAAALSGVALGAGAMWLDPTIVWSDVTTFGAILALGGAYVRLQQPDRILGADEPPAHAATDTSPPSLRILLAACAGPMAAPALRIDGYLSEYWQAGIRYSLFTLALSGLLGAAAIIGSLWLPDRADRGKEADLDDTARAVLIGAGTLLIVAISQTLPGTVAGTAIAAALTVAAVVWLASIAMRADPGRGGSEAAVVVIVASATWVGTWWIWPTLIDAAGSSRVALAVCAVPALAVGAAVALAPAPPPGESVDQLSDPEMGHTDSDRVASSGAAPRHDLVLEAEGIEFSYGAVQVLFGVDLKVHQGEVVALLGTNGAGKTTFLRTVAGLATPSAGSMRFYRGDLARFSASDRVLLGINEIASGMAVAPELTVEENLAMFGHTLRVAEARAGAERALEVFPRLAERRTQRASALSGGERQMLALSKSLVLRPRLLVLDECTLGLAPVAVAALVPVIRRLHDDGASVLLVEQSIHLALDLADRAVCMEKGRIVYESSAQALRDDPGLIEAVYLEGIAAALEQRDPERA